jgi:hypothetical protein
MRSRDGTHRSFLRSAALAAATFLWLLPALASPPLTVLTIDAEYLESTMPLYASITAQAEASSQGASAVRRSDLELARELRHSEVLTALPEAIAEVARAAEADLVVDRAVARRLDQASARDITRDVERILVARFGQLPLEPGS